MNAKDIRKLEKGISPAYLNNILVEFPNKYVSTFVETTVFETKWSDTGFVIIISAAYIDPINGVDAETDVLVIYDNSGHISNMIVANWNAEII